LVKVDGTRSPDEVQEEIRGRLRLAQPVMA
jgi:hypothetical protein